MKRGRYGCLLFGLGMALATPGWASTPLRVMSFFPPDIEREVIGAFERAHPDIKVEFEPMGFGDEYFQKIQVAVAGGVPPDVVALNFENYARFATQRSLEDLAPWMARDAFDAGQYFPAVLNLFRVGSQLFGLPATFSDVVMFYNKNLFDSAGLAYPDAGWKWPGLLDAAKRLTKDLNGDDVIDQHGYAVAWWPLYIWLAGGEILRSDGRPAFDTPAAAAGIQAMVDTWLVHRLAPSPAELVRMSDWDRWQSGKLAMYPIGPWGLAPFQNTAFDWDAAHHPPIQRRATFLFSNPLAVTAASKQKEAAWAFVKFAAGPEGTRIRQGRGYEISPVAAVARAEFGKGLARPQNVRVFLDATAYAQSPPGVSHWNDVTRIVDRELNRVRAGEVPALVGLARAAQRLREGAK